MPRDIDLTGSPVGAWISPAIITLQQPLVWAQGSSTRFQRIAVVETDYEATTADQGLWPVFNQLFSLLALLPLQGIVCPVVATPLLGAGHQNLDPEGLFPALLERCRSGFRHVPDLERLIVFDRQRAPLELLAAQIDRELGRGPDERQVVPMAEFEQLRRGLHGLLAGLARQHPSLAAEIDLSELSHLLAGDQVTPVALGMHCRRLVERLVRHQLGWRRGSLYQGLRQLQQRGISPWTISCLHQVRVFGNWMGHPSPPERRQAVTSIDLATMLAALHRLLETYPWI